MATDKQTVSPKFQLFLLSSDDPGPWDLVAVEPSTCPGEGQDLAELETREAETVPVSNAATRAVRPPTTCSTLAIFL